MIELRIFERDESTQTDSRTLIVCEILCYIQNKMDNISLKYIVKTVVDFYNESDIQATKTTLFAGADLL